MEVLHFICCVLKWCGKERRGLMLCEIDVVRGIYFRGKCSFACFTLLLCNQPRQTRQTVTRKFPRMPIQMIYFIQVDMYTHNFMFHTS